jgi:hypothetical protein
MPTYLTMADPPEPEPTTPASEDHTSEPAPSSDRVGITPEQLAKVIRRLETGFYDQDEIREQIARRALDDLGQ